VSAGYTLSGPEGGLTTLNQPFTGFYRIACNEACQIELGGGTRDGVVWNVSTLGLYLVLPPPLPEIGERLSVRFRLTGDPLEIVAQCRVVWQNAQFVRGAGQKNPAMPPGCGVQFVALQPADHDRIEARVRATYPGAGPMSD
jgi:hypothetical protein